MYKLCLPLVIVCSISISPGTAFSAIISHVDFESGSHTKIHLKPTALLSQDHPFAGKQYLHVAGNGKSFEYPLKLNSIATQAKQRLGISCNYRTSKKLSGAAMFILFFKNSIGKTIEQHRVHLSQNANWRFVSDIFDVPKGAQYMVVTLRLSHVPAYQYIDLDNLTISHLEKKDDFKLGSFVMAFDDWNNTNKLYERCTVGENGKLLRDWQEAHVGEACFVAHGDGSAYQYPLWIRDIAVHPGYRYSIQTDYRTSAGLTKQSNPAMLICFFRDAAGKKLGQTRLYLAHGAAEWKTISKSFVAPSKAVSMQIGFRLYNVAPKQKVYFDHVIFKPQPARPTLKWHIDPKKKQLIATVVMNGKLIDNAIKQCQLYFTKTNGQTYKIYPVILDKANEVPIANWPTGMYGIQARIITTNGKILNTPLQKFHTYKTTPWVGNNIGKYPAHSKVPTPWEPLIAKKTSNGISVHTWNNNIEFTSKGQLQKIKFIKTKKILLDSPMRLTVNGKHLFTNAAFSPANMITKPNIVYMDTQGQLGKLNITVGVKVAFDGLTTYKLTFTSDRKAILNEVRLSYDIQKLEYLNRTVGDWRHTGVVDMKGKTQWSDARFYPILWTGNMRRGLYWMGSNLIPAKKIMPHPWVKIKANGNVNMKLVMKPVTIDPEHKYQLKFSLGITPMRPDEHLWRTFRFRAGKYANADLMWSQPKYFKFQGFPQASNPKTINTFLKQHSGEKCFFYSEPTYAMTGIPQWSYFQNLWRAIPSRKYSKETSMKRYGFDLVKVDVRQPTWTDLYLKHFQHFLKQFAFDGVYYDTVGVPSQLINNKYTYSVYALRNFLKRIYITQRNINPNSLTFTHKGASFCGPSTPFSDLILMGEQYRAGCYKHDYYLQFISLRKFRFENCTDVGPAHVFLPQYRQESKQKNPRIAVSTMGLVLCHNLLLYPNFINHNIVKRMRGRKFAFGLSNAKFYPYWRTNPYGIKTNNTNVICSFYQSKKGLLLTYLNTSGNAQSFSLTASKSKLAQEYGNTKSYVYWPLKNITKTKPLGSHLKLEPYMAKMTLISPTASWSK